MALCLPVAGLSCTSAEPTGQAAQAAVSDQVTFMSASTANAKRTLLIERIWGSRASIPTGTSTLTVQHPASGSFSMPNLHHVDRLTIATPTGITAPGVPTSVVSEAFHYVPTTANGRAVIVHQGHDNYFGLGLDALVEALVARGYGVIGMYMPNRSPSYTDGSDDVHNVMFNWGVTPGSAMKFFLEPVAVSIAHVLSPSAASMYGFPAYNGGQLAMVGLSGGAWTTVLYAAIDPRITLSVPVAGSLPLYLRRCVLADPYTSSTVACRNIGSDGIGQIGDQEQMDPAFFSGTGYLDLYVLGAYGAGRRQVQVLHRNDPCCFSQTWYSGVAGNAVRRVGSLTWDEAVRDYEDRVQDALLTIHGAAPGGWFRQEIDETTSSHQISPQTRENVILAELEGNARTVGSGTTSNAFVRGADGELWHHQSFWGGVTDVMEGPPAVVQASSSVADVLFRGPHDELAYAHFTGSSWTHGSWGGTLASDPVVARDGSGQVHAVALGIDERVYRWHLPTSGGYVYDGQVSPQLVDGTPAIAASGTRVEVLARAREGNVWHLGSINGAIGGLPTMVGMPPGKVTRGTPTAVIDPGGVLRVYALASDARLWEAWRVPTTSWSWASISSATAGTGGDVALAGSPSATVQTVGGVSSVVVFARRANGDLARYSIALNGGSWTHTNAGHPSSANVASSPTAVAGGAWVRGTDSGAHQWLDSGAWQTIGGVFY